MTASRVLSGKQRVSESRRVAVLAAVVELGFVLNDNARTLRPGNTTGLVGVLVTNLTNPYYAAVLEGIEETALTAGLRILIGTSHEDRATEADLLAEFARRRADGLVVVPASRSAGEISFDHSGIPLVFASRHRPGIEVDSVIVDDLSGTETAVLDLIRRGHARVGFIAQGGSPFTTGRRLQGFRRAHVRRGIVPDPGLVAEDVSDVGEAVRSFLLGDNPPTAIFAVNNRTAVDIVTAFARLGLGRSDAPALAVFDNFDLASALDVDLVVVEHDPVELGRTAMGLLLNRMLYPHAPLTHLELPTRLVEPAFRSSRSSRINRPEAEGL